MYRLFLLRHADAVPAKAGESDINRPLSDRGRKDAEKLGTAMKQAGFLPVSVLSSTALRTRQTWKSVASGLESPSMEADFLPELYRGDAEDYRILIATSAVRDGLLVIGHNPMIHELAFQLLRGNGDARSKISSGFVPGALAVLDFPDPLWNIGPRTGTLSGFLSPGA